MNEESTWARNVVAQGSIPFVWVHSTETFRYGNLGDALSAVIVAGLSGLPLRPANFRSTVERMAAIGTIGHSFVGGTAHLWGTGIDRSINVLEPALKAYRLPPDTRLVAHAVRGPFTRQVLVEQGVDVPPVYGDAAWFLPRFYNPPVAKTHDIGVVMHISELTEPTPYTGPKPEFVRYDVPADGPSVRLINTYHEPDYASLCAKMDELLSCRRIVSTSFHGLMLAERYGIPCAYFGLRQGGGQVFDPTTDYDRIDHRVADFYAGAGNARVATYDQPRLKHTDWDAVIRFVDRNWSPLEHDFTPLLEAFPCPLADRVPEGLLEGLRF